MDPATLDITAAIEHVFNAVFDVLLPAVIAWGVYALRSTVRDWLGLERTIEQQPVIKPAVKR